jgi:hypothetical protein
LLMLVRFFKEQEKPGLLFQDDSGENIQRGYI